MGTYLTEAEAWERIATWWDMPEGCPGTRAGLCTSVDILCADSSISDRTRTVMHYRVDIEVDIEMEKSLRAGDLPYLYPPGENRTERAALCRRFAEEAAR